MSAIRTVDGIVSTDSTKCNCEYRSLSSLTVVNRKKWNGARDIGSNDLNKLSNRKNSVEPKLYEDESASIL